LSHRIALSKVLTNLLSGEPPSKRLVIVLRVFLCHSWAPYFGALTHYWKHGSSKPVPQRKFLNPPFKFHSCNCQPWFRVIWKPRRNNNHANLRENRCDFRRYRRNRSRQRSSSRSLVRLSSSEPPSSLWLLPSPSLLRLSPLLPSSLSPSLPAPLVLARRFFSAASLLRSQPWDRNQRL